MSYSIFLSILLFFVHLYVQSFTSFTDGILPDSGVMDIVNMTDLRLHSWRLLEDPAIADHTTKDSLVIPYDVCDDCLRQGV